MPHSIPDPTPGEPLLKVDGLATGYGDLKVVRDVSLVVLPGRLTAMLGRNGAGKTTTLRAISGLNRTMAGSLTLRGQDLDGVPAYQRARLGLGSVQEGKRIFAKRTLEENLILGAYAGGARRRRGLDEKLERAYDIFQILGDRRNERASALSGGQQQMLAIAQALMGDPAVLLLDEPSAGLAPAITSEVFAKVAELKEELGLGVLLVEQAVDAALEVADLATVIELGHTVLSGPVETLGGTAAVREAYMGRPAPTTEGSRSE